MTMTMNRAMTDGLIRGYLLDEDRRAANDDGILTFTATSAGVKRDGLNLDPTGGQWENFMRNPVFLWVHDYWGNTLPIGRVNAIGLVDTKIKTTVKFDLVDPFAAEVHRKYIDGYLNAVSIGWDTLETDGNLIIRWDLLDVSAVPVPGDPDALLERAGAEARRWHSSLLQRLAPIASDSTQAVSEDTPDPRAIRATVIEQIDQAAAALTALRDTLAEDQPPEPPPEVPPEAPPAPDLGPVLQALGESND